MQNEKMPRWFVLLQEWRDKATPPNTALSFPFLVGATLSPIATNFADENAAYSYSLELYTQMVESNIGGKTVLIYICNRIGGPAVKLEDGTIPYRSLAFHEVWRHWRENIVGGQYLISDTQMHWLMKIVDDE